MNGGGVVGLFDIGFIWKDDFRNVVGDGSGSVSRFSCWVFEVEVCGFLNDSGRELVVFVGFSLSWFRFVCGYGFGRSNSGKGGWFWFRSS